MFEFGQNRKKMNHYKFIVLKGKNTTPGKAGTQYVIFDTVEFICEEEKLENEQRKYAFRKFYEVDNKKNPQKLRDDVFCRRRHILLGDGSVFASRVKIFDHEDGTYYAFVPIKCFNF